MLGAIRSIYKIKSLERTGWVKNQIERPETVGAHSFGAAFLAFQFAKQCGVDEARALKMALLHDVQESIIGDITPYCGISEEEKFAKEVKASQRLSEELQNPEVAEIFNEFEAMKTPEARFVKECDKLDMLIQAQIYEQETGKDLSQFFTTCTLPKEFASLVEIRHQIEQERRQCKSNSGLQNSASAIE